MRALEIPTSSETGLSVEALELALRTYPGIKAVMVVPHLQNPLGASCRTATSRRCCACVKTTTLP